jgi:protein TonB
LFRDIGTIDQSMLTRPGVERRPTLGRIVSGIALASAVALGCSGREQLGRSSAVLPPARAANAAELASGAVPRMLNVEPPFRYPTELYARKVQGNVTLRLHVDSTGHVRPESTTIVVSSGYPALDSAAVQGAAALAFAPAVRNGRPVGLSIRFPVYFRHPAAPRLPGDSLLKP